MPYHLLIVEDDRDLAANLVDYLSLQGYIVEHALDGYVAEKLLFSRHYDLAVFDITLPGIDGMSLCRRLRAEAESRIPVVMLTAKDDLDVKVSAFDCGADDYVVKPVALRELEARIRALIRRAGTKQESSVLTVGDLSFDMGTLHIERAGRVISMPPVPTRILALLMRQSPNVVHQQAIFQTIWGDGEGDRHVMVVHMHALRSAVDKPFDRQLVHTVRGFGYRIAVDNAER